MNITKLLSRDAGRDSRATSHGRRERRRSPSRFRLTPVEVFEDRVLLSSVPALYSNATGELTDPAFKGLSLANNDGLTATVPTLVGDQIVLGFTNSGSYTIEIGVAVYKDPPGPPPIQLSNEVFQSVQYFTIAAGKSLTVKICDQCQVQVDSFIHKVDSTTESNVVKQFSPFDNSPHPSNAGPPVDAGYNTAGYQPTSASSTTPPGILGTLLSYTATTSCNCDCGDNDGGDDGDCGDRGDDDGGDCGDEDGGDCGGGSNNWGGNGWCGNDGGDNDGGGNCGGDNNWGGNCGGNW